VYSDTFDVFVKEDHFFVKTNCVFYMFTRNIFVLVGQQTKKRKNFWNVVFGFGFADAASLMHVYHK
jgi:hypothetical protein